MNCEGIMAANRFIGRIGEYDSTKETFTAYCERTELFFLANDISVDGKGDAEKKKIQERKKAIFLTEVGPEIYSVLCSMISPQKPKDKTFEEISSVLKKHFDPAPLEIAESYRFGTRNRGKEESISEYIVALKKLAIHCNFADFLDRALRDRFVIGLGDEKIQ